MQTQPMLTKKQEEQARHALKTHVERFLDRNFENIEKHLVDVYGVTITERHLMLKAPDDLTQAYEQLVVNSG